MGAEVGGVERGKGASPSLPEVLKPEVSSAFFVELSSHKKAPAGMGRIAP